MPVTVRGTTFYAMGEVAEVVGVVRQTLWRWRKAKKVPLGRRYRGREVLYTEDEMEAIYAYAHRLEPEDARAHFQDQLNLFTGVASGQTQ